MKIKMLFVAMAVFALASISHAQFNAGMYNFGPQFLTTGCDGTGEALGADCNAVIYWDANGNGPDAVDQPPVVGDGFGECNFNSFPLNGADWGVPGGFFLDGTFTISTVTPQPSLYYLVVECHGVRWTSQVVTIVNGLLDYDFGSGWTCEVTVEPCDEPTSVRIDAPAGGQTPTPFSQCIALCAGAPVEVCVGFLYPHHRPHAVVVPGCFTPGTPGGCDVDCPPAQFGYDDAAWTYNPSNGTWCNWIIPGSDGCVCFTIEFIEGVVDVDFSAIARDSKVELAWSTGAESDMSSYRVMRRAVGHEYEMIATVAAANSNSGSTYTYVDESADNGTSYEYTLNMVDINDNVTELGTIASATPSANLAVITEYALHQNYPNPFNPSTSLVFDVVAENTVNLTVYNAMGQEVATLVNGTMNAGRHTVSFDAANLTSGLYFYTVKIGNEFTATKKMLLVK